MIWRSIGLLDRQGVEKPLSLRPHMRHHEDSDEGRYSVSHDSGFRSGGRDLTHQKARQNRKQSRTSARYDRQNQERFKQQERKATSEEPATEEPVTRETAAS